MLFVDLKSEQTLQVVMRTLPYLGYRAAIRAVVLAVAWVGLATLGLVGWVYGMGAFLLAIIGAGLALYASGLARTTRGYLSYYGDAGLSALTVESVEVGDIPGRMEQIAAAHQRTVSRCDVGTWSRLSGRIDAVLADFHVSLADTSEALRVPGLDFPNARFSCLRKTLMAHLFSARDKSPHGAAFEAIELYVTAWKGLYRKAALLTALGYAGVIATFTVLLILFAPLAAYSETVGGIVLFLMALSIAVMIKATVIAPFANISMQLSFLEETTGKEPDQEWLAKLAEISPSFRDLKHETEAERGDV